MTLEAGQILKRLYECKNCHKNIRLEVKEIKPDGKPTWKQLNEDGMSPHECKQQQPKKETTPSSIGSPGRALDEELKSLRELLVVATRKLDNILLEKRDT